MNTEALQRRQHLGWNLKSKIMVSKVLGYDTARVHVFWLNLKVPTNHPRSKEGYRLDKIINVN